MVDVAEIRRVAEEHAPDGGYGETSWHEQRATVFWNHADWTSDDEHAAAEAAFRAIDGVDDFECASEANAPDGDGWTQVWPDAVTASATPGGGVAHHNDVLARASKRAYALEDRLVNILVPILDKAADSAASAFRRHVVDHEELGRRKDADLVHLAASADPRGLVLSLALVAGAPGVASTSTMVAVKPRPEEADALAEAGVLDPETLHVTLAYIGDTDGDLGPLVEALARVAATHAPLTGQVAGVGAFTDNGKGNPVIALPSVPGLVELRVDVTKALQEAGIDFGREHGYQPHLTLAYDDGDAEPELPPVASVAVPLHFDELLIVRGDREAVPLPLTGVRPLTAAGESQVSTESATALEAIQTEVNNAEDELRRARASGDPEAIFNAERRLKTAHKRLRELLSAENPPGEPPVPKQPQKGQPTKAPGSTGGEKVTPPAKESAANKQREQAENVAKVGERTQETNVARIASEIENFLSNPVVQDIYGAIAEAEGREREEIERIAREEGLHSQVVQHEERIARKLNPSWAPPGGAEVVDTEALATTVRGKTDPVRQAVVETTAKTTLEGVGIDYDVTNPFISRALASTGAKITNIAETTRADVMGIIDKAYSEGYSIPDTAKLIQSEMKDASPVRARLIARTELVGAVNGASLAATQVVESELKLGYRKVWKTAPGAKYPRHEDYPDLDGEEADSLDGTFTVGDAQLQYPGDPNGPPEECCNCRCTLLYVEGGQQAPESTPALPDEATPAASEPGAPVAASETAMPTAPRVVSDQADATALASAIPTPGSYADENANLYISAALSDVKGHEVRALVDSTGATRGAINWAAMPRDDPEYAGWLRVDSIGSTIPGGGTALMREAAVAARDAGTGLVLQGVSEAWPFYRSVGFEQKVFAQEGGRRVGRWVRDVPEGADTTQLFRLSGQPLDDLASRAPLPDEIAPATAGRVVTDDPAVAAKALAAGDYVELGQTDEIATMIDDLGKAAADAQAAGQTAANLDLGRVSVKGTNLFTQDSKGIPRIDMPQLKGHPIPGSLADAMARDSRGEVDIAPLFYAELRRQGVKITSDEALVSHLRATQKELDGQKVAGIMDYLEGGGKIEGAIPVSREGYIVDGHHRWAAEIGLDYKTGTDAGMTIAVDRIDEPVTKILSQANAFAEHYGIPQASAFVPKTKDDAFLAGLKHTEGTADTVLGITPFRPEDTAAGFYDSAKAKQFESDLAPVAQKYGVTITERARVTGVWGGASEPSYVVRAHDGVTGVANFAEEMRAKYNQDSALVFRPDENGGEFEYTIHNIDTASAVSRLSDYGIDGATIRGSDLILIGPESEVGAAIKLGQDFHGEVSFRRGVRTFASRKTAPEIARVLSSDPYVASLQRELATVGESITTLETKALQANALTPAEEKRLKNLYAYRDSIRGYIQSPNPTKELADLRALIAGEKNPVLRRVYLAREKQLEDLSATKAGSKAVRSQGIKASAPKPSSTATALDPNDSAFGWKRALKGVPDDVAVPMRGGEFRSNTGVYNVGPSVVWQKDGLIFRAELPTAAGDPLIHDPQAFARSVQQDTDRFLVDIPADIAASVRNINVFSGANPDDAYWAKAYGRPDFVSGAASSNGETTFWNYGRQALFADPILSQSTFDHEIGHLAGDNGGPLDRQAWVDAANADSINNRERYKLGEQIGLGRQDDPHGFLVGAAGVSDYGSSAIEEDFAESMRLYMLNLRTGSIGKFEGKPVTFEGLYPERAKLFEQELHLAKLGVEPGRVGSR